MSITGTREPGLPEPENESKSGSTALGETEKAVLPFFCGVKGWAAERCRGIQEASALRRGSTPNMAAKISAPPSTVVVHRGSPKISRLRMAVKTTPLYW